MAGRWFLVCCNGVMLAADWILLALESETSRESEEELGMRKARAGWKSAVRNAG
ncbi:MAG: hypothetical protein WA857_19060 [Candidatus Acidiferrum sp.]